jgi:predicted dehydrogenase
VRVIQAGLGNWGRSWAEIVRDAEGTELAAVVDRAPEARRFAAEKLGLSAADCYGSLAEALEHARCDAVLLVTPPGTHHALILEALRAGKHVLVEKPLDTTLSGALSLVDAAEEAGRLLMVSQNYRFNRPFRAVQRVMAEGALGKLSAVKISCRRDMRDHLPADDFRYSMRHPYVMDMAIHHFDLLRAATGQNVRRVYGRGWRVPDSPFSHHPAMAAVLELDDGTPVTYAGDWACYGPETSWNGEWELTGEAGRLFWTTEREERNRGEVVMESWRKSPRLVEQPRLASVERAATLAALRVAIEGGEPPETGAADNVNSLAVVLSCVRSIESGEPVDVEELLRAAREGQPG